jgi:hypothetical protein
MKKILLYNIFIVCGFSLFSQGPPQHIIEGEPFDYQEYIDVFSDLDINLITTGFLVNKSIPFVQYDNYNGTDTSKTITMRAWKILYDQLNKSQTKSILLTTDSILALSKRKFFYRDEEKIPVFVMDIVYNEIKEDAFNQNLLQIVNSKIVNSYGFNIDSPYLTKKLFAASILKEKIYTDTELAFIFESDFYFTNQVNKNTYQIDFDDGNGFRKIEFGQTINISYNSVGNKSICLKKYSHLLDTQTTTFSITVKEIQSIPNPAFEENLSFSIPVTYPEGGVIVKGKISIYTSDGSRNIKNPIIICDGFDPENERNKDDIYELLNQRNFANCLLSNGYDLIILDPEDGGTYIERNAYLMKGVIERINSIKTTNNKLIVVGPSMGGLICRYALAYMEKNNIDHDTRLFISFDSPHNGANIPLGIQYWFEFFSSSNDVIKKKYNNLLCSKAARQMLIYHVKSPLFTDPDSYRVSFLQNINNLGYPTNLRKIAIANGAGNAYGQRDDNGNIFNPTDQIVNWNWKGALDFLQIVGNAWALPDISPLTKIFDGSIKIIWFIPTKSLTVKVSGSEPYDNAPGGTTDTAGQMKEADTDGHGTIKTNVSNHCFIPIISSLSINTDDLFYNISTDPNILSKTPFDAIYYPINKNEEHIHISEDCVNWVFNELVPFDIELDSEYEGEVRAKNSIMLKAGFKSTDSKIFNAFVEPLQPCK